MTQKEMFPTAISSQRATPVSRSVSRESKKAQKMTATSGRTSLELLHTKDRLGAFSKTFMVTLPWASTKCCLTWKPKATPQGRLLFQLAVSTLPIEETDSGLLPTVNWPTPSASDVEGGIAQDVELENNRFSRKNKEGVRWGVKLRDAVNHTEKMWPTPRANKVHPMITEENREQLANRNKSNLEEVVAGHMWPTPRANEPGRTTEGYGRGLAELVEGKTQLPKKMWPTPAASEGRQGYQDRTRGKKGSQKSLTTEVIDAAGGRQKVYGQLNPTWVEWLMGYPEGWTDLKD